MLESLASSIGAGMVVGGFIGGVRSLVKRSHPAPEKGAVAGGYAGGAVGLVSLLIDTLMKAFV